MTADAPMISVVIPTRDRSELLRRAVDSVLSQTYGHYEIVVVDDASEDGTAQVVDSIGDSRIRYVRNDRRKGAAESRNIGVRVARGRFVAFLDSDDEWLPRKLECQVEAMLGRENPDIAFSYGAILVDAGESARVPRRARPLRGKLPSETVGEYLFLNDGVMQTSTFLLSRTLAATVRFESELRRHQDWDLCLRLEQHAVDFVYVNEALVVWHADQGRQHVSSEKGYRDSLEWIAKWRHIIHPDVYAAFVSTVVAGRAFNSGARAAGLRYLTRGMLSGRVPARLLARTLSRAIPSPWRERLRDALWRMHAIR